MIPYLIRRGLPHVDISSALQMMLLNLLAHLASVRVLAERWPTFPAKARGNVPAPPRGILSRARRLRSEACAAVRPASRGCTSCPPAEDFAQPRLSPAHTECWASVR